MRTRSRKFLVLSAGVVAAVLVLELCARVADWVSYGAPLWGTYNSESIYELDQLGRKGRPHARYKKWQLNSLGFRGPELRPGGLRIVCFGASETFGLYEAPEQEYPRQLERELRARSSGSLVQVINVAYPGETVVTATRRVPEIIAAIHPQIALLYPSVSSYIWMPWARPERPRVPPGEVVEPPTHFEWRIWERLRTSFKEALPEAVQDELRRIEIRRSAAAYGPTLRRVPDKNIAAFRQDMTRLIDVLRAEGVQPVLITHASRFSRQLSEGDQRLLRAWRKFYPMMDESGFLDMEQRMNDAIRQVAAAESVPLIDAAREMPKGEEYFADYEHFTTAGADAMADRLADGLQPVIASLQAERPVALSAAQPSKPANPPGRLRPATAQRASGNDAAHRH